MRIVSLLASGTEIVVGLGAGDSLVGRSHECDNPPWVKRLPACTQPAFDIEMSSRQIDCRKFGARLKEPSEPLYHFDTKLINSLEPDFADRPGALRGMRAGHAGGCRACRAAVAAGQVMALGAGNVQGIHDGIFAIGRAVGREQEAADLVGAMKRRIDMVKSAVKDHRPVTVVALEWTDPMFAMGNWGPELVEAANGRPLLGENGEHSRAIDWQQVHDADPEWLIIAPCGFDLERATREAPMLEGLPGWFDMRAVRQGQVALADGNTYFNRSGTTIVETVEIVAEILHGYPAGREGKAWVRHSRLREWEAIRTRHARACASDRPSYTDPVTGYDVFTADFLSNRGYCCGNVCRHCPYPDDIRAAAIANCRVSGS